MYFVHKIKNGKTVVNAPFESKDDAIRYFNLCCDSYFSAVHNIFNNFDSIEILDDNGICLFDYEV